MLVLTTKLGDLDARWQAFWKKPRFNQTLHLKLETKGCQLNEKIRPSLNDNFIYVVFTCRESYFSDSCRLAFL